MSGRRRELNILPSQPSLAGAAGAGPINLTLSKETQEGPALLLPFLFFSFFLLQKSPGGCKEMGGTEYEWKGDATQPVNKTHTKLKGSAF